MSGQSSQRTAKQRPDLRDFRIPVHGHTHPRNGGALADGVGGGGSGGGGGGGGGGSIVAVTDGITTVSPASEVNFTSGATVTDLGGGIAGVAIGGGGITPYYIAPGDTFTVPLYKQSLYTHAITVDGAIVVDGILLFVD